MKDIAETLRESYRIERELGRGGMATVYLACDLKHDFRVTPEIRASPRYAALLRTMGLPPNGPPPGVPPR